MAPSIRTRDILVLFLPLAATSTMMSLSSPVIHAGLARLPSPEVNLAAFGLAFALSIFLESPVFALQQATVAWYGGGGPIRPYVGFAWGVGLLMMAWMTLIAWSPAAPFVFRHLMGADEELARPAVHALRAAVLFPPLVSVRSAYQAVLISRRHATPIAWGTFIRLIMLALGVFFIVPRVGGEGPTAAMLVLTGAVFVEMVYTAFAAIRTPEVAVASSPAQSAGLRLRGRVVFMLPLATTMILGTLTNPVISGFIARAPEPKIGLAVYSVVASLVWFLASSVLRYSSVTIALGTDAANRRQLIRFLWRFVGGVCTGVLLIVLTPARDIVLERIIGLSPELAARAHLPLILLAVQPLTAGFIAYHQGVLTRAARTQVVGFGALSRLVVILGLGVVGLNLHLRGELTGSILLGSAFVAELATLWALGRRARRA